MSEVTTPEPAVEPEGAKPDELGPKGQNAIAAVREERKAAEQRAAQEAARAAELEAELTKVRESQQKSEQERAAEIERLQGELESASAAKARAEVAAAKSIPLDLMAGPKSNSSEDLAAFADAIIAFRGTQPEPQPRLVVPGGGETEPPALNSDRLEQSLRAALGITS